MILDNFNLNQSQTWLVCTSTHGAGDFPENILPFVEQLQQQRPDLSNVSFAVCALGDTSYDTFCEAGVTMDKLLEELGAKRIYPMNKIDISNGELPEDSAEQWLAKWKDQLPQ